ncbi:MAG: hypothetical protein JWQ48_3740 [Conexibacter sp.]|jgi:hypothetical protein|nr:hypothetical protein [Conexibacter sp.]
MRSFPSFAFLRTVSFVHSAVYLALLVFWLVPGLAVETTICGWAHGILWIFMSFACIAAARRGTIPFWLAVVVAVIGGVGPFAGTIGFVVEQRRRAHPAAGVNRARR